MILCPDCGHYNSPGTAACTCGRPLQSKAAPPRKLPLYLAILPLLLPLFFVVNAIAHFTRASAVVAASPNPPDRRPPGNLCVETYGITLSGSHEYVPQQGALPIPVKVDPNKPREFATILRGTARNTCSDAQQNVALHITIKGEAGATGATNLELGDMPPGIARSFEHAWMGKVMSWEITSSK